MKRRDFLRTGALAGVAAGLGTGLDAGPLGDMRAFAGPDDDERRLVVVVLRGGMDGLHVVPPLGDGAFAALRGDRRDDAIDLDGFFAVDRGLAPAMDLWHRGELGFVHAVSSPYRSRSHFDGQDALENGTASADGAADGWLNRAVGAIRPGTAAKEIAVNIGTGGELILRGPAPVSVWNPASDLDHGPEVQQFFTALYEGDPHFEKAYSEALLLDAGREGALDGAAGGRAHERAVRLAARLLRERARVVAFSILGWDTHTRIDAAAHPPIRNLAETLVGLRRELGSVWNTTTLVAVSEFGRTARLNGTQGTDHGTGGVMVLAGGGVRGHGGGRVTADWPGLASGNLLEDRDLAPTGDIRRHVAWQLVHSLGLGRDALERTVFPGLDMGADPFV